MAMSRPPWRRSQRRFAELITKRERDDAFGPSCSPYTLCSRILLRESAGGLVRSGLQHPTSGTPDRLKRAIIQAGQFMASLDDLFNRARAGDPDARVITVRGAREHNLKNVDLM